MESRFGGLLAQQQRVIEEQKTLIDRLTHEHGEQARHHSEQVRKLEADVEQLSRQLFGRKSEKQKIPPADRDDEPPSEDELVRRKLQAEQRRRERALKRMAALPVEESEWPLSDSDKHCPHCSGTDFAPLPPEQSSLVEYVPGRFTRRRIKRHKAACRCGGYIVTAKGPGRLIPGGQYGPGFAAYLVVAKCADSIPIHRLETRFARMQIPIPRSTMNDLVLVTGERLAPLYDRLRTRMPSVEIVLADETSMRIQDRDKKGFIWVFHGQDDQGGELVLYVFATDRSSDTPKDVLGDSSGALVCDGYTGYNVVEDPEQRVRGGCWCHARRKFFDAKSTAPQEAERAISEIRELFRVEHQARLRGIVGTAEHLALRTARSKPVVDKLFEWLAEHRAGVLPKSPLGTALTYMMNQRARLELFLTDPRVPLHNNASEHRLRVVALGRKNYLFVGHPRAGRLIAGLYSLVGTCIANDVEPTAYLADVLTRVDDAKTDEEIDALLPDRWTPLGAVKTG